MKLDLDADELRPLVREIVSQTIDHLAQTETRLDRMGERLGFTEPEAAELLGIKPHVLSDARRRGEVQAKLIGKRFIYSRDGLRRYLAER